MFHFEFGQRTKSTADGVQAAGPGTAEAPEQPEKGNLIQNGRGGKSCTTPEEEEKTAALHKREEGETAHLFHSTLFVSMTIESEHFQVVSLEKKKWYWSLRKMSDGSEAVCKCFFGRKETQLIRLLVLVQTLISVLEASIQNLELCKFQVLRCWCCVICSECSEFENLKGTNLVIIFSFAPTLFQST